MLITYRGSTRERKGIIVSWGVISDRHDVASEDSIDSSTSQSQPHWPRHHLFVGGPSKPYCKERGQREAMNWCHEYNHCSHLFLYLIHLLFNPNLLSRFAFLVLLQRGHVALDPCNFRMLTIFFFIFVVPIINHF